MIAQERLYLTSDRRRVVEYGNRLAAFLLAAAGAEINKEFVPLVQAFYASKTKPEPSPMVAAADAKEPPTYTADEIEGYETRIPKSIRRRGRPRKQVPGGEHGFSGD